MNPRNIFLTLLSGVLYGLSFPPYNLSLFAWICLVPGLLVKTEKKSHQFIFGLIFGTIANIIIFSWLWDTFDAAGVGKITTLSCWLAMAIVLGLYFGLFCFVSAQTSHQWHKPLFLASLWVFLESIRGFFLTGFPWALLGHTQATNQTLLQMASLVGVPGISFLLVAVNVYIAGMVTVRWNLSGSDRLMGLSLVFFILIFHLWGWTRINKDESTSKQRVKIGLLQGNIDPYEKWSSAYESKIRKTYEKLIFDLRSKEDDLQLIIWPESSVPGWYPTDPFYEKWVKSIVKQTNVPHLIGAVTRHQGKEYNALFHVDKRGQTQGFYAKQHLVPFGEYIPFGGIFKRWIPYLGQLGTFDPGPKPNQFKSGHLNIAPNICYEAIFPGLIRKGLSKETNLLVNVTNDGWYIDTGAPEQHYVNNIFRAVETGRPVVRVANTGISAVIDSRGTELFRSALLSEGAYSFELGVQKRPTQTIYLKIGRWFVLLCWIGMVLGFVNIRKKII